MSKDILITEFIQPFQIEELNLRGRIVQISSILNQILNDREYPYAVARLLAETVVAASVLARTIKYDGLFTLQTSGNGPVSMMIVDITSEGVIRACAKYNSEKLDRILEVASTEEIESSDVRTFLAKGRLAFTVDQNGKNDTYQGIVELYGRNIAACIQHYFKTSEQINTAFKIGVNQDEKGNWFGTGLMLQALPDNSVQKLASDEVDNWRRAMIFMETLKHEEMINPDLNSLELLYRLFHEDGIRIFDPQPLTYGCRCSRAKLLNVLQRLTIKDIEEIVKDGKIIANCEFCNSDYTFTENEIRELHHEKSQKK